MRGGQRTQASQLHVAVALPQTPLTLYLASLNPAKMREFREAAADFGISLEPVRGLENFPGCVEDGRSYEENARKKAVHYSLLSPGLVFADDSGISVNALGGAPGIHSARYAGAGAGDAANNEKLLQELRACEQRSAGQSTRGPASQQLTSRWAHYVCVIALAERGHVLATFEGRADGTILETPRGHGGFGYDPLFFFPPLGQTFAELAPHQKFQVSHRGEAFRKLLHFLRKT